MKNYVQDGKTINHTLVAAKTSGQGVIAGALFGVAVSSGAIGDEIALQTEGVYAMPAGSGDTYAVGAIIGYDETANEATAATLGDKDVGICTKAKLSGETSVEMKIVHGL